MPEITLKFHEPLYSKDQSKAFQFVIGLLNFSQRKYEVQSIDRNRLLVVEKNECTGLFLTTLKVLSIMTLLLPLLSCALLIAQKHNLAGKKFETAPALPRMPPSIPRIVFSQSSAPPAPLKTEEVSTHLPFEPKDRIPAFFSILKNQCYTLNDLHEWLFEITEKREHVLHTIFKTAELKDRYQIAFEEHLEDFIKEVLLGENHFEASLASLPLWITLHSLIKKLDPYPENYERGVLDLAEVDDVDRDSIVEDNSFLRLYEKKISLVLFTILQNHISAYLEKLQSEEPLRNVTVDLQELQTYALTLKEAVAEIEKLPAVYNKIFTPLKEAVASVHDCLALIFETKNLSEEDLSILQASLKEITTRFGLALLIQ